MAADQAAAVVTSSEGRGVRLPRALVSLRHRDFRWLMLGQLSSTMAQWSDQIIRGWIAYQLTGSALLLGSITAARAVPLLFFSLLGGVLADRFDRRRQIILAQGTNVASDLALAALVFSGHIEVWHLFFTAFVAGAAQSFMMPARQSLIPNLVPRADLMNAVALNAGALSVSRALGPTIAGLVLAAWGGGAAYLVEGLMHLLSGASVAMLREPPTERSRSGDRLWVTMTGGLRYALNTPVILLLLAVSLIPMLIAQPYQALLPIFAEEVLAIGPTGLGMLASATGVGAIVGVILMATAGDMQRKGLLVLAGMMAFGLCLVVFALSSLLVISLLALFVAGLAGAAYPSPVQHLLHTNTPDHLRGRVMSLYLLDRGFTPLGALLLGALGDIFSAPVAVAFGGAICALLGVLVAVRKPDFSRLP